MPRHQNSKVNSSSGGEGIQRGGETGGSTRIPKRKDKQVGTYQISLTKLKLDNDCSLGDYQREWMLGELQPNPVKWIRLNSMIDCSTLSRFDDLTVIKIAQRDGRGGWDGFKSTGQKCIKLGKKS